MAATHLCVLASSVRGTPPYDFLRILGSFHRTVSVCGSLRSRRTSCPQEAWPAARRFLGGLCRASRRPALPARCGLRKEMPGL